MSPVHTRANLLVSWTGSAATTAGGLLMAQSPVGSVQSAGIGVAICGLITVLAPMVFKDRSEARALRVKELERANQDKDRRIAELEHVAVKVPVAEANIAATQGEIEALRETLHAKGWLAAPVPFSGQRRPRTTVLIIEDNPDTARALMKLFTLEGFAPSYAPTLDEAFRLLEFGNPHWVILDLIIQGQDGLAVLRKVREERLSTHIAVITGTPESARLDAAKALHPDILFRKPVDFTELIGAITQSSGRRPAEVPDSLDQSGPVGSPSPPDPT